MQLSRTKTAECSAIVVYESLDVTLARGISYLMQPQQAQQSQVSDLWEIAQQSSGLELHQLGMLLLAVLALLLVVSLQPIHVLNEEVANPGHLEPLPALNPGKIPRRPSFACQADCKGPAPALPGLCRTNQTAVAAAAAAAAAATLVVVALVLAVAAVVVVLTLVLVLALPAVARVLVVTLVLIRSLSPVASNFSLPYVC